MNKFLVVTVLLSLSWTLSQSQIIAGNFYNIYTKDHLVATIGGSTFINTKVSAEALQGTSPRQRFYFNEGPVYEIRPEQNNLVNSLVLERDDETGLVFQQLSFSLPSQMWKLHDLGDGAYLVQNEKSGTCIFNSGEYIQLNTTVCDRSAVNQQWEFRPAIRLGDKTL